MRTTLLCPLILATSRGVWQSSFITSAFAGIQEKSNYQYKEEWAKGAKTVISFLKHGILYAIIVK